MNADEIVRALREMLPPKVDYAELVCAEGFAHGQFYVWDDPEPYIISAAADLIESLQAQLAEKDAEIKRLNDEPPAYKFYYCESEDSYLLGRRVGNFYYAHWHDGIGFVFDMSRYLPWGEHVVAPRTVWKEHTYPSEPKEINLSEWFNGFLAQRLSASHRREQAAVELIGKVSQAVEVAFNATDYVKPNTGIWHTLGLALDWIKAWRGPGAEEGAAE